MAPDADDSAQGSAEQARAGRHRRRWQLVAVVLVAVVIVDQASKEAALRLLVEPWPLLPGVGLALSFNTGAAFSMGTSFTPFITAFAGAVLVAIAWFAGRAASAGWALVLGLVGGGAAGNLIDRLVRPPGPGRGAVVDFVDVAWFAAFNLADVALTTGVAVAFVLSWRRQPVLSGAGGPAR
ncbi:signal peptidase II [Pseudonocardia sp. KRD-184]|uniref:Lipoprotein signal peptidase n=1 Tax=Pseudonocardia oceani TaxID=2792013 RepID=A0ABS6U3M3_9PSEU|nr:signal peptidase II [Pseudonocardia oceani]MBW0088838.1 signal peptidase II [Pseudonocardia oceani]MBW0097944.1 signal peptidase II [Pseudonocardia oceani]MBW0120934.1 signal peptidase II [Pseudonocardia oceani]MBW0126524.1 signal peptidase II [Pseudonocardia oceani]